MTSSKEKKEKNRKGLIIGFIIILLSLNAILLILNNNKSDEIDAQQVTIEDQDLQINQMVSELDSVQHQMILKRQKIVQLEGNVAELDDAIAQLQTDKEELLKENKAALINLQKYKDRVDALSLQLRISDEKIADLKAQRDAYYEKYKTSEEKRLAQQDSILGLKEVKQGLEKKIAKAAVLEAIDFRIDAVTDRGKVKEGPELKERHLHKLRVSFNLAENELSVQEGKVIYLCVKEPSGGILFNTATGGGFFKFEDKELPYTLKQEVLYKNNNQQVSFDFLKGSPWKEGNYAVEIYAEGYKIGESKFIVD